MYPGRAAPSAYIANNQASYDNANSISLGRYRLGDVVNISFFLAGQTSVPVVTISGPSGTTSQPLTTRDGQIFTFSQLLVSSYQVGTYTLNVSLQSVSFDVVAGGDPSGGILGIYATKNVQGWQVLAQLKSGRITLGKNPTT